MAAISPFKMQIIIVQITQILSDLELRLDFH